MMLDVSVALAFARIDDLDAATDGGYGLGSSHRLRNENSRE